MEALSELAAVREEEVALRFGLDSLRERLEAEVPRKLDDRRDETIIADSGISMMSRFGFRPKDSIVLRTCRIAVGCQNDGGRLIER